jgi:hypothetical protein
VNEPALVVEIWDFGVKSAGARGALTRVAEPTASCRRKRRGERVNLAGSDSGVEACVPVVAGVAGGLGADFECLADLVGFPLIPRQDSA